MNTLKLNFRCEEDNDDDDNAYVKPLYKGFTNTIKILYLIYQQLKEYKMDKQQLIKDFTRDLEFANKHKNKRPSYWEGAIDVLEDILLQLKK